VKRKFTLKKINKQKIPLSQVGGGVSSLNWEGYLPPRVCVKISNLFVCMSIIFIIIVIIMMSLLGVQ